MVTPSVRMPGRSGPQACVHVWDSIPRRRPNPDRLSFRAASSREESWFPTGKTEIPRCAQSLRLPRSASG